MKNMILIKNKCNKKGFVFAILDFWSILFFVAVIIILLIYISFANNNDKENVKSEIMGINFPHYFMNIMQSEKIILSEFNSNCDITQEMTRLDALQYFDSQNRISLKDDCFKALRKSVRDDDKIFGVSFDEVGINVLDCKIIAVSNYAPLVREKATAGINKYPYLNLIIPTVNGNIEIMLRYGKK